MQQQNQTRPVRQQPAARGDGWMTMPLMPLAQTACPPGLEYLSTVDTLKVRQKRELGEIVFDYETRNKYHILNGSGQIVYLAAEESDCCSLMCGGKDREFILNIMDSSGKTIIRLDRPYSCCSADSMQVSAPPGNIVGFVSQELTFATPKFDILDDRGSVVLRIKGPMIQIGTSEFNVFSRDGATQVGRITKEWGGILREMTSDADKFAVTFPVDLDVKIKAVLLGALFLIDFMYFEN